MQNEIMQKLSSTDLKIGVVSASHLPELGAEINNLHADGALDNSFHARLVNGYLKLEGRAQDNMQTLLVVTQPAPIGSVVFNHNGRKLSAVIPPTYMDYSRNPVKIESWLNTILGQYGYSAVWVKQLPEKLLAARSGLAKYGKNNITYVDGLGSFVFLSAYSTDMPCYEDAWGEVQQMDACGKCTKCVDNCPTGAIQPDRRVIVADRCLTMHNEESSFVPFPAWIDPSAHNSIIGCMQCQAVCPMDKAYLDFKTEPVEFDEVETTMLLNGKPVDELPHATQEKLKGLNMNHYYEPLARNIKALFDKQ